MLTSHDSVREYHDIDVRRKLTYTEEHSSDDAAHNADSTTSKPVGKCTNERTCDTFDRQCQCQSWIYIAQKYESSLLRCVCVIIIRK